MNQSSMGEFWDRRANEDAFYFVDNRLRYGHPDLQAFWEGGRQDLETILDQLSIEIARDDDIVEIGCGVGRITRALADRGSTVRALDVSGRMLALAAEHNPTLANVDWIEGDGTSLRPIEDASVDFCFSHVVFQHIPESQITLGYVREMGRVLRPGGRAAFQISNRPDLHRRRPSMRRLRAVPSRLLRRGPGGQAHEAWLGSAVELDDLRFAAASRELELVRVVGEGTQWCLVSLRKRR